MEVMTNHLFHDDVEKVLWSSSADVREIVFTDLHEGSLLLSKEDVVALAKEFNLVVYNKDTNL